MSDRPPPLNAVIGVVPLAAARLLGRLALLSLASPLFFATVEVVAHPWAHDVWMGIWRTVILAGPVLAAVLGVSGATLASTRGSRFGAARIEGGDLVVEGAGRSRRFPLASLRSGVVVPGTAGALVQVEIALASGDQLVAEVDSVDAGERLLAAAGIDAAQRRCTVPLVAPGRASLRRGVAIASTILGTFLALGLVINAVGPINPMWIPPWLALTTAAAWLAARVERAKSITVGADGIVVPGLFGERFLPFTDIASVQAVDRGVAITLRAGTAPLVFRAEPGAARAVALRVQEAMAARSDAPAAQARLELLARGGRTLAAWRDDAARLVGREAGYRAAGLSEDDLTALLADPGASAEQRVGAAFALAAGTDAHRERVRIAAEACASPRMRVALERIAGGDADDAAVEEALAAEAQARATAEA